MTLRWLMLHTRQATKKLRDLLPVVDQALVLELLMKTAQFEFRLTGVVQTILDTKQQKWESNRKEVRFLFASSSQFDQSQLKRSALICHDSCQLNSTHVNSCQLRYSTKTFGTLCSLPYPAARPLIVSRSWRKCLRVRSP